MFFNEETDDATLLVVRNLFNRDDDVNAIRKTTDYLHELKHDENSKRNDDSLLLLLHRYGVTHIGCGFFFFKRSAASYLITSQPFLSTIFTK